MEELEVLTKDEEEMDEREKQIIAFIRERGWVTGYANN